MIRILAEWTRQSVAFRTLRVGANTLWFDEGRARWHIAIGTIFRLKLATLASEPTLTLLGEVVSYELPWKFLMAAAWWKE